MKTGLLILLLLGGTLEASTEKPVYKLTIVDAVEFSVPDFWKTPEGLAFWKTTEGKTVLTIMGEYRDKMEKKP